MKKFVWVICLMFLGYTIVSAQEQDLGTLAKKEKERREALAKQGKITKSFTNADIPNLKATLAIESTSPPPEPTETETAAKPAAEAPATEAARAEEEDNEAKIEDLKAEKEELEQQAKEARENVGRGGVFFTPNVGSQFEEARKADEQAEEKDKEIKKLQKENEQETEE